MEKKAWLELLMDYYGQILTDRQRAALSLYCGEDLSLAEIAEQEGISRQGVRDALQRGEHTLVEMEEKLQLANKCSKLKLGLLHVSQELVSRGITDLSHEIEKLIREWEG